MNEAETVEVTDYTENFPRDEILQALVPAATDKTIAAGATKPLVFNDAINQEITMPIVPRGFSERWKQTEADKIGRKNDT